MWHFDRFQNQPPGESHHLGEVRQGRSKSKYNIMLSYSKDLCFGSGFHNPNYLENSWLQCTKISQFEIFKLPEVWFLI